MQQEIFPREVTSNVPRVTLTGRERLLVEQHQGLETCTETQVSLRTSCGLLTVTGQRLLFQHYSKTEALIAGEIESIRLTPEGRRG
ncbi:MAG: YabP/YqfC family sporulation protein [Clostridia bacterium]|nr:YabP/YqfC family sporulation protein [Clostridia bacterium]